MSIGNIYLVVGSLLWLYLLLWLFIRVAADRRWNRSRRQKEREIQRFFSPACTPQEREELFGKVSRYARETFLFQHICDCYSGGAEERTRQEKKDLIRYMKEILNRRVRDLGSKEGIDRYLLIHDLFQCQVVTPEIEHFLLANQGRMLFEQAAAVNQRHRRVKAEG